MILFTGRGTSGSWQIRGVQIAKALGARSAPLASIEDCKAASAIVAVKRIPVSLLANIRKSGRPWAWDVVDAYPQPQCSRWGRDESLRWFKGEIHRLKPDAVIFPNRCMAEDIGGGKTIYHHHRPEIEVNPIRQQVLTVGYEGGEQYLGRFRQVIETECKRRGWAFVVNPQKLADLDIVLAVRDHAGYAPKHWKSNVKLSNAQGAGTPIICARERGYVETASGAEAWADTTEELIRCFDELDNYDARKVAGEKLRQHALPIESVAKEYKAWLRTI